MDAPLLSLPPIVAEYARVVLKQNLDKATRERLIRLVTESEMGKVWKVLSRCKVDNPLVFREYVRIAALSPHLATGKKLNHGPSAAVERRTFQKVARLLRKIFDELAKLSETKSNPAEGLNRLLHALHRAELESFANGRSHALRRLASLRISLEDMKGTTGLDNALGMFWHAAEAAALAPPPAGPRKKGAVNAARTAYVQELSNFVRHHFKKPLYQVVATTTNVAFNEFQNAVTPDLIRKLTASSRKVSSKIKKKSSAT
jgi:hypothetical protein